MADGSHVPLTKVDAERLWRDIEAREADLATRLPDEDACLRTMMDAHTRLEKLGWRDAIYCPKDGTVFEIIEAGSTAISRAHYEGTWPNGRWWAHCDGDLWPSRPILFRPISASQEAQG
jgi:hypothetical protein